MHVKTSMSDYLQDERYMVYVYIGHFDESATKIGMTTNLYKRLCVYNTSHPFTDFKVDVLIKLNSEEDALYLEQLLHLSYDDKKARHSLGYDKRNVDNEWITIRPTQEEISNILQKLYKKQDISFPYEVLLEDNIEHELQPNYSYQREKTEKHNNRKEKMRMMIRDKENARKKAPHKTPYEYQLFIIEKMFEYYQKYDKGYMIEPCGIGKTFLAIWFAKENNNYNYKNILIGVSNKFLQGQMEDEIKNVIPEYILKFIGGDQPSTSDEIQEEMSKPRNIPMFVITTYDSCHKLVGLNFDLKIGDECHHLASINKDTKSYLDFHKITSMKSLFMTATEKLIDTNSDKHVFSMDDEDTFGKCIDEKSVKWAIENKVITDYNVVVLKTKNDTLNEIIGEIDIQLTDKNTELFMSAYMTLKSMEMYKDLTHVLCYTNTTDHANQVNQFIDILLDKGIFSSLNKDQFYNKSLHSENSSTDRLKIEVDNMKKKKYGIISCVFIFGEGFNLPKLNGVCFVENMVSNIRIIQCALRASRIEEGNILKKAYMLIPTVDHDDFYETSASYNKIRTIIGNLANVDENISERLMVNTLSKKKEKRGSNASGRGDVLYFENSDFELKNLRLRLRRSKDLTSKLSMEEEEYIFYKALLKQHNIKNKREYDEFVHEDKKDDIERYFKQKGVWADKGWYDLLSIDTSIYPSSKDEWKRVCQEKNIKSMEEYKTYCEQLDSDLPSEPDKLYHKDWTSSIEVELGIIRPRRR
tara:strand:+ start:920 stop:3181 length:2262 start_codon:yes stop_codon:yes gene_type:complete